MIFPTYKGKQPGYANLNLLAEAHAALSFAGKPPKGAFLDPTLQERLLLEYEKAIGANYSYGGWLEDRSTVWNGTYLDEGQKYIHAGIDIHAPAGTPVTLDYPGVVVHKDDDFPEEGGWGPRVLIKLDDYPITLIYAHLDPDINVSKGDHLSPNTVFARIGPFTHNGGWFPHVHVQALSQEAYSIFLNNPTDIDGYISRSEISGAAKLFPDPLPFVHLL